MKFGPFCVLILFAAMMLPVGSAQGDDWDEAADMSTALVLSRQSAGQPLFGARLGFGPKGRAFETGDGDIGLWPGVGLRFRLTNLQADSLKPHLLRIQDSPEIALRRGRVKLGEHPLLPWLEIYSQDDFKLRGFPSEQELRGKGVDDGFGGATRPLRGGYLQAGYFFHEWWERVPASLEIAGRVALVDPDTSMGSGLQEEWTLSANWFFRGHGNRITADFSYMGMAHLEADESVMRFQVRWDISF